MPSEQSDQTEPDPSVVELVPVHLTEPTSRRHRTLLGTGLGVAGAVAALAACGPTSGSSTPAPYTPVPYTPPSYAVPTTTTTTTTTPTTTTTTPTSSGGGSYGGSYGGGTLRQPCLPTKIPRGYVCTCNCVPD